jgi:hypothetical protein
MSMKIKEIKASSNEKRDWEYRKIKNNKYGILNLEYYKYNLIS